MDNDENAGWEVVEGAPDRGKVVQQFWGPDSYTAAAEWMRQQGFGFNMRQAVRGSIPYRVDRGVMIPLMPDDNSVKQEGYEVGTALATLIGVSATFDFQAVTTLGIMFAELKGYRDMKTGNQFVGGMVQGFQDTANGVAPKRLGAAGSTAE